MNETESEVLAANRAFYVAFATRDASAMEEVWANGPEIACIHPGWDALLGRREVMESWRDILDNPDSPRVRCTQAAVQVRGEMAFVVCIEDLGGSNVVATNVFVREGDAWKIVHHHGGLLMRRRTPAPKAMPPTSREDLN